MNVLNESAKSSVSGLKSASVDGQSYGNTRSEPTGHRTHHHNSHHKSHSFTFNGIFDTKPTAYEGSLDSDSTHSPVVSPMVALQNHSDRQSPTRTTTGGQHMPLTADDHSSHDLSSRKGRKRKARPELDSLQDKLDVRRRIQKSQTTEELVQKYNIEVNLDEKTEQMTNNRNVSTVRTKRKNKVSESTGVDVDHNQTESKSELMQRFFSSQSSTTSPAINDEYSSDYIRVHLSSQHVVTSGHTTANACEQRTTGHPIGSPEGTAHASQSSAIVSSNHQKCVSNDIVGEEIDLIMSRLPPINDMDLTECVSIDNNSSDSDFISVDNRDHNHNRDEDFDDNNEVNATNSDLETNNDSNNSNLIESNSKLKEVPDYHVDRYCDQRWEHVSGTYDADAVWRPWNRMTSALSFNGDILHILPYVDVDVVGAEDNQNDSHDDDNTDHDLHLQHREDDDNSDECRVVGADPDVDHNSQ